MHFFNFYRRNIDALFVLDFQTRFTEWLHNWGILYLILFLVSCLFFDGLGYGLLYLKGGEIDFFQF
jgi:hypothetical protein